MDDMPQMAVLGHRGLGDHLVLNAIYRKAAETHQVFILCKRQNAPTIAFMFRDIRHIKHLVIQADAEAKAFADYCQASGHPVLRLGDFGSKPFNRQLWDREIYRQAGVPFQDRWNQFKVSRQPSRELTPPSRPFCFIHEDPGRGFIIDRQRLPRDLLVVEQQPDRTNNLFDWWAHVEAATELHLIDSCFAIMADSLPSLRARRLVLHLYARPNALPPSYNKNWDILK